MTTPIPLEEVLQASTTARKTAIGLPASAMLADHRFPLTPEGAGMLVERGFDVKMERGAAAHIHYSDDAYAARGVEIVTRTEALACDIVIYLPAMTVADARAIKRGALLLTMFPSGDDARESLRMLLRRHVIALSLDMLRDSAGMCPFADIMREIGGRAAIAVASSLLADSCHGKGILLGGVAGIVPCEVMIVGADLAAEAAARSALGLGAMVRVFDNNVYALRRLQQMLGPAVIGSTIHPKVFESALRTADIVVATTLPGKGEVAGAAAAATMKRGVICFDLTDTPGAAFPSLQEVDLDMASPWDNVGNEPTRMCYIHAGNAVPRTVAMALSNAFVTTLDEILVCDGVANALKLNDSLRRAAFLFLGKCVNRDVATALGERWVDINLFLQFS